MSPLWFLGPVWVSIAVLLFVRFRKWNALKRELAVPPPPYELMRFTVIEPGNDIWPISAEERRVSFGTTPRSLYSFGKSRFHDPSRPTSFVCTREAGGAVLTATKEILVNGVGHRKRLLVTGDKIFFDEIRIVFDGVATVQPEPAPPPRPTFVALGAPLAALALFAVFVRDPIPIRRLRRSSETPTSGDRIFVDPEVAPPGMPPDRFRHSTPIPAEPAVRAAAPIVSEPVAADQTHEVPDLTVPQSVPDRVERRAAEAASARIRKSAGQFPIVAESAWPLGATSQPSAPLSDMRSARLAFVEESAWVRGRAPEIAIVAVPEGSQATVSDTPDESVATPNRVEAVARDKAADLAADSFEAEVDKTVPGAATELPVDVAGSTTFTAESSSIPLRSDSLRSGLITPPLAEADSVDLATAEPPSSPEVDVHEPQEATLPEASPLAATEPQLEELATGADTLAAAAPLRGQSEPTADELEKQVDEVAVAVAAIESSASHSASSPDPTTADGTGSRAVREVGVSVAGLQFKPLASFGPLDEPEFFDADMMFIHAHPDDEAIDFGGLMARMSRLGRRIVTVIFTDGESGIDTYPDRLVNDVYPPHDLSGSELATVRRMELERSLLVLGSDHYLRLGLPNSPYDGIRDVIDPADVAMRWGGDSLVDQIARLIEGYQPDVVVSPDGPTEDAIEHFEHEAVGLIVERALERLARAGDASFLEGHLTSLDPKFVHLFADAQGLDVTGTDSQSSLTFRGIQIEALKQHVTQADAATIAVKVIENLAFEHYLARQWSSAQSVYQFFEYPTLAFGEKR